MQGMIFKPDSIQAIIEGRKTQTRRVIKQLSPEYDWEVIDTGEPIRMFKDGVGGCIFLQPRYQVGETVYIKEAWAYKFHSAMLPREQRVIYKAMESDLRHQGEIMPDYWRSPMMMPQWAARYFITITDVRAGRIQEITEEDCLAEGISYRETEIWRTKHLTFANPRFVFADVWNSINKDYPFESNPWVWVYTLRLERKGESNR